MATAPPTASAVPAVPDRSDRTTFSTRAIGIFDYVKNTMWTELTAFVTNAYTNAQAAYSSALASDASANAASVSAAASAASATAAASASGAAKWVSGTTYPDGTPIWSPINYQGYRRKGAGAGTIDPSIDALTGSPVWVPLVIVQTPDNSLAILNFLGY